MVAGSCVLFVGIFQAWRWKDSKAVCVPGETA